MPSKPAGRSRKAAKKATRAAAPAGKRARTTRAASPPRSRSKAVRANSGPSVRTPRSTARPAAKAAVAAPKGRALSKRELDEFQRRLEAERDRLTDELEAIEDHLPEVENISVDASGGYDEDLADVASDAFEREKGIAIEISVSDLLNQVEEALVRIESGTYGVCQVCGQPIHLDRLRALPYARLCIGCKAREEQAIPR